MKGVKGKPACTPDMWMQAATEEAQRTGLRLPKVLGGSSNQIYVHARWRVWRELVAAGYSYWSIGQASGFDHTAVIYGCDDAARERHIKRFKVRRAEQRMGAQA